MERTRYPPLEAYGIVGNLETCALASRHGSIDWLCLPDVESPSVFAALLDADRGGHLAVAPVDPYESAQSYVPRTNVLETHLFAASGRATITDWMPFPDADRSDPTPSVLYRRVRCTRGSVDLSVEFAPRFDYARTRPELAATDDGVVARGDGEALSLSASPALAIDGADATATPSLSTGETAWFVLRYGHDVPLDPAACRRTLRATVEAWRRWTHRCRHPDRCVYDGRWHHLVVRAELALKLLIHHSTGAIAAAPTTSLPERVGGPRNWDYRYNWIRDAALTVQALYELGHLAEARAYFDWLLSHVYEDPASIRPIYGLHGGAVPAERTLDHLEGYRGSTPVRVGNAAAGQRQLDVYGELVLGLYETSRYGAAIGADDWRAVRAIVDHVADIWEEPDAGIWEVRTEPQQFVHSKVMCWVALDRGIEMVEATDFDGPVDRWRDARAAVRDAVLTRGYDESLGSFVQTFGADDALDATALLVPIVGFLPFDDPRVQGTIDAVRRRLTTDDGLVYRYDADDGLPGGEGTFVLCSFWLVDALALSGRAAEAEALFESVLSYASPLGLFAEEISAETGALLGNFPQAYSHIGLINCALYLDRGAGGRRRGPEPIGAERDVETHLATE